MAARRVTVRERFLRLPEDLRNAPLVNWQFRDGKKLPVNPDGTVMSNLNSDPTTVDFDTAVRAVENGKATGIGLPLFGSEFCVLDIDDCVVDGVVALWARKIVEECGSYSEYSPSGNGIHIYFKGKPNCGNHTQVAVGDGHVDFFVDTGYVTLTGRPIK